MEEKQNTPQPEETPKRVIRSDDEWYENWPLSETSAYKVLKLEQQLADALREYLAAKRKMYALQSMLEKEYSNAGLDITLQIK